MTDERRKKYHEYAQRLEAIKKWTATHQDDWLKLCFSQKDITLERIRDIMEECTEEGYMEIYLMMLTQIADLSRFRLGTPDFEAYVAQATYPKIQLYVEEMTPLEEDTIL